jgi:serine/threonine protein kinase
MVKFVRKDQIPDFDPEQDTNSFLMKEVRLLATLDHPNIVRFHELAHDRKRVYAVMDYCKGGPLFSKIGKTDAFSEGDVCRITG